MAMSDDFDAWRTPAPRDLTYAEQWDQQARKQLRERAEREVQDAAEPLEHRTRVTERIKAELREAGLRFDGERAPHGETPETVRKKLNLTQAQWDALPDARPGAWKKLCDAHKPK
jgi:hypothetical protein